MSPSDEANRPDPSAPVPTAFVSMAARDPDRDDADYLAWHALEHQPEIQGVTELRHSWRLVSTPACRAARPVSTPRYDAVDHVVTYLFSDATGPAALGALGKELAAGGLMSRRLPSVEIGVYVVEGSAAPPSDLRPQAIPRRPARGAFLLVEQGSADRAPLIDAPGVAGVWWAHGVASSAPHIADTSSLQFTWGLVDDDPIETIAALAGPLHERWAGGDVVPLLAAPFHTVVPFAWSRHLP